MEINAHTVVSFRPFVISSGSETQMGYVSNSSTTVSKNPFPSPTIEARKDNSYMYTSVLCT